MYMSPEMGGLRVSAAVVPRGSTTSNKQNTTEVAARYNTGPLTLGLGYTMNAGNIVSAIDNVKDRKVLTVGARYDFSKLNVGLTLSKVSEPLTAKDSDRYSLGARYPLTNELSVKFGYEHLKVAHKDTSNTFALGGEYRLSKRTMLFSEVGQTKSDIRAKDDKGATFIVGIAHRF
jgi:predicted porin